jgi:hypothetical protein
MSISIPAYDGETSDTPNGIKMQSYWINRGNFWFLIHKHTDTSRMFSENGFNPPDNVFSGFSVPEAYGLVQETSIWPFEADEIVQLKDGEIWANKQKVRPSMFPYKAEVVAVRQGNIITINQEPIETKFESASSFSCGVEDFKALVDSCYETRKACGDMIQPIVGSVYRGGSDSEGSYE